ncbi:MAG TPA: 7TM diverse intracellular signaling domain-containing protein [Ramlibacter sp.]|nr:7TM diverse intracellular signaling domain-containing protein [Ramlibacter sp.]
MARAFWAGLCWLCACAFVLAQDVLTSSTLFTAPSPGVIRLSPDQPVVPLEARSRWWIDESARATVDDVEAAGEHLPWATQARGRQFKLDGKALWEAFDAQTDMPGRWFVEVSSSGVDRVQMFYRDAAQRWVVQEAGDTRPVSAWPLPGRVPTFDMSPQTGKPVRYWLRVEHARVDFASPISIYHQGELFAAREREQFMLGAYFGLSVLIALVSAGNAIAYRDRTFATYAVYVAALALGQAAYLGVGAQHLWDRALKWNEISTFLLPGLSASAALWFVRTVTEPARFSRALDLAVWSLILALLSAVALDTWLTSRATFGLQMALTALAIVAVIGLILYVWVQGDDPHIRLIALGFVPVLAMAVFPVLRGLNLIPVSLLTRYGVTIGAMIEMPILFYALMLRANRRREAEVRASALSRNDALTGLAHTRTLLQRLEAALTRARSLRHPCALMAVRIANFDAIVAEFGRDAIEKVLVVAASHLRRAIGDIDLAARVGNHDFALLLEGPTSTSTALSKAQHVIASGLRQADALPPGLTIKFHVAVALLPDQDYDAAASLKWVLGGVTHMPNDARKLIRPLNF